MADCLDGVGGGVDDGHHCRDDPEEDSPAHRGDRGDVQLVDQECSLLWQTNSVVLKLIQNF